jgi:hypothetical protein
VRAVEALAQGKKVRLDVQLPLERNIVSKASDPEALRVLENRAAAVDLYLWMAQRFPLHFADVERAESLRDEVVRRIETGLYGVSDLIDAEKVFQAKRKERRLRERAAQKRANETTRDTRGQGCNDGAGCEDGDSIKAARNDKV